jgi:hypothetical protein
MFGDLAGTSAAKASADGSWFPRARDELNRKVKMHPEDARLLSALAIIDVAFGRKVESIKKARRAVDMLPVSKDAMDGPLLVEALATVYALN